MNDSTGPADGPPKIIIDDDWKAQARREKEQLAAKEREASATKAPKRSDAANPGAPGAAAGAEGEAEGDLVETGFKELVGTFVMQALLYLGGIPDPQTGRAIVSLEHARFNIDMLAVLEEKTKGNLSAEETTELAQALNELRNRFVEITRAVAQMQAKQAAAGGVGGVGGMGGAGGGAGDLGGAMPNLRLRHD